MNFEGALVKWNSDRGFGFIAPAQGEQDIFVHISAFPRDGIQPTLGEPLSFTIELAKDGRKRAVNVRRPFHRIQTHRTKVISRSPRHDQSLASKAVVLILLVALGAFGYSKFAQRTTGYTVPSRDLQNDSSAAPPLSQKTVDGLCDGRTYCSQMTSCSEAKFFLKNCPGTQMDGNNNGVPCEQQWCTSPFAK